MVILIQPLNLLCVPDVKHPIEPVKVLHTLQVEQIEYLTQISDWSGVEMLIAYEK